MVASPRTHSCSGGLEGAYMQRDGLMGVGFDPNPVPLRPGGPHPPYRPLCRHLHASLDHVQGEGDNLRKAGSSPSKEHTLASRWDREYWGYLSLCVL